MKARLLYRDRDFPWAWALQAAARREAARTGRRYHTAGDLDRNADLPWNADALTTDLALETLFTAMARDDDCIFEVARKLVLDGVTGDLDTIRYRQAVLGDCLDHAAVVRALYAIAVEGAAMGSRHYLGSFMMQHPDSVLRWSIETLEDLLGPIVRLRKLADSHAHEFVSEGWTRFFAAVRDELSDAHIAEFRRHLAQLRFRHGVLLSAGLGTGNKGAGYVLHLAPPPDPWLMRLRRKLLPWLFGPEPEVHRFALDPRDESGFKALGNLKNRGIAIAAGVLGHSAEHVRSFFGALQAELGFYVGCVNLHEHLAAKGEPLCRPEPVPADECRLSCRGLYDVCLTLRLTQRVVGNDIDADDKDLIVITGANQGGKSTFLRSVGLAQLMMQCGMFVPAVAFRASVCDGLFTHYKREEDAGMESGKLDEELGRMSAIVDHLTPNPVILFNESFAATNEREGSEIARQIVSALLEKRIRTVFVTHLYAFAQGVYETNAGNILFLRAGREADGTRTFRLIEGQPLQTSFGDDLYGRVFGDQNAPPSQQSIGRRRVGAV